MSVSHDKSERQLKLEKLENKYKELIDKLSSKIGFYWWKRYVAGAVWANIESPLSLCLTLTSTVISAQASTSSFMSQSNYVALTFVSVLLSTINTYYRPLTQVSKNCDLLKKWYVLGNDLEKIVYAQCETESDLKARIAELNALLQRTNEEVSSQSPENQNFLLDLIHLLVRRTCLGDKEPWLSRAANRDIPQSSSWFCCKSRRPKTFDDDERILVEICSPRGQAISVVDPPSQRDVQTSSVELSEVPASTS